MPNQASVLLFIATALMLLTNLMSLGMPLSIGSGCWFVVKEVSGASGNLYCTVKFQDDDSVVSAGNVKVSTSSSSKPLPLCEVYLSAGGRQSDVDWYERHVNCLASSVAKGVGA